MSSIHPASQTPCLTAEARCAHCATLIVFDKTLDTAKQTSKDAQARLNLLSNINHGHDLLSKYLPIELCANIFSLCLDDIDFLSKRKFSCRSSRAPLHLSQVCRSWRKLAHSIPFLWTLVPMFVFQTTKATLQVVADVAGAWIRRSGGNLPLSIILDIMPGIERKNCRSLFKAINSCSPRLRFLQISATAAVLGELFSIYRRRSSLTDLRLMCFGPPPIHLDKRNTSKFRPTHLFLENAIPKKFGIDTKHVTHFSCHYMSLLDCTELFLNTPQMISCILDDPTYRPEFPPFLVPELPHSRLTHPSLKILKIKAPHKALNPEFLFKAFNFPSLESLTLRPPWEGQTRLLTALVDNLRSSESRLTTFALSNLSFTDMGGTTVLVDLINTVGPILRHLELSTADDFDGETGMIASVLNDASTRLPQLRSVKIFMNGESNVRTLQKLLLASAAIAEANVEPLSFIFWTYDHMIRDGTGAIDFDVGGRDSEDSDGNVSLVTSAEICKMVSALRSGSFSVAILVSPDPMAYGRKDDEDKHGDLDMTENIIGALDALVNNSGEN